MKKPFMFLLLFAVSVAFADQYDQWVDETVKVLISRQERDAFKKLKTDAEKEKFVADFWAKRDPSPGTPENEFKKAYEERLKIVNEKLGGAEKKAVDADMGKTVLLLGTSTEQKKGEGEPPRQTWIWRGLPKEMGVGDVEIEFVGDPEQGGYVFSDPKAANATLEKARNYFARLSSVASNQASAQPPAPGPEQKALSAAGISTPTLKAALDATATGNAPQDVPLQAIADSFMASTGEIFATVAVTSTTDTSSAKVGVRIISSSGAVEQEAEFAYASASETPDYFQASLPATLGEHTVVIAVAAGEKTGGTKIPLSIPDYLGKFSMSSLILSKEFKQLPDAKPEKEPYTFGKIKVRPAINHEFAPADELIIVYEAYNFKQKSPEGFAAPTSTGKPDDIKDEAPMQPRHDLEVVFTFQKDADTPKSTPAAAAKGLVSGKKITIPTSYPLAKFPPGKYKLTVALTDKATGEKTSRETSFVVK